MELPCLLAATQCKEAAVRRFADRAIRQSRHTRRYPAHSHHQTKLKAPERSGLGRRLCIKSNELLGPRRPFAELAAPPEPIQPISEAQPTRLVGKLRATLNVCRTSTFPKDKHFSTCGS